MTEVFSGGVVFEYFEDTNDFGLVTIAGDSSVSTLADFNALSTQIHSVSPAIVTASAYNPTNTAAQACPTVDANWQVAPSGLPPKPDASVCNCMMQTLTCTVATGLNDTQVGDLFGEVCGYNNGNPCLGIQKNTVNGTFGPYSMCNSTEMLSYAFNAYYQEENTSDACNFGGAAQIVKAAGAASTCSSVLASATANSPTSPTNSGAAASSSKKGDAGSVTVGASLGIGTFCFVAYAFTAIISGAGIMWL